VHQDDPSGRGDAYQWIGLLKAIRDLVRRSAEQGGDRTAVEVERVRRPQVGHRRQRHTPAVCDHAAGPQRELPAG
jgi:hypothetical protein